MDTVQFYKITDAPHVMERTVRNYVMSGWKVHPAMPILPTETYGRVVSPRGKTFSLGELVARTPTRLEAGNPDHVEMRDAAELLNLLYALYGEKFIGCDPKRYVRMVE
jgi:hypothetical protein